MNKIGLPYKLNLKTEETKIVNHLEVILIKSFT